MFSSGIFIAIQPSIAFDGAIIAIGSSNVKKRIEAGANGLAKGKSSDTESLGALTSISRRSSLSDNKKQHSLPPGFIDALIGYALDPLQWESFARELERAGSDLQQLDPSAFLAALSQAESLAFQLRGQPEQSINRADCIFYLLDAQGGVIQASESAGSLQDYCRVAEGGLAFASGETQKSFRDGLKSLANNERHQVLIELTGAQPNSRYGYLVEAADLPAALNLQNDRIKYGLLIAQADSSDHAANVLQSSFGLTASETAVCQQLSTGLQLKEVAKHLDISTNTARNHLQSVFDKTSINRQGDLILMMTQLSVILSVIGSYSLEHSPAAAEADYPPYQFMIVDSEQKPRRLAYRRYGNGDRVVVYCHESVGSSRLPPGTDATASQLNLSIIAPERPGAGFSDPLEGYSFNTTAADITALVDELAVPQVSLLGYISGGTHALAAAAALGSRVNHLMLVAARGPASFNKSDVSPIASLSRRLTDQPWLLATFFNILRNRASEDVNRRLLLRVYGTVEHDRQVFKDRPEILDHMIGYTLESMVVSAAGIVGELRCFSNPVPINLRKISAPVSVWHGDADTLSAYSVLSEELQGLNVAPRIFAEHGSILLYEHWDQVLNHLSRSARA